MKIRFADSHPSGELVLEYDSLDDFIASPYPFNTFFDKESLRKADSFYIELNVKSSGRKIIIRSFS